MAVGRPLPGVEVVALPVNPARLRDSLTAAAPGPAPAFPALEAELRAFQPPPPADLGIVGERWAATRDSVVRLSDSLRAADQQAPGYRAAYERFRALYRRLAAHGAARDAALEDVAGDARILARRVGRAADSLRRWESEALAPFDSLLGAAMRASGRDPARGVPDHEGRVVLQLAPGAWWITWRVAHPENPFLEYAWRVPVVSRRGLPFAVPLMEGNGEVRWRH